jgi:alpha-tubulin suppressor-like RCC1 family protein
LAAGETHSCALLDNGTLKCWGFNHIGQLGLGDTAYRGDNTNEMGDSLPAVSLGTGRTAVVLSTGANHVCALLDNGSLKCWGFNSNGQLGLGDTSSRGDGANEMGDALPAVSLGTGRTVRAVSCGASHVCALLDNGSVKCWGSNQSGQLGLGDGNARGDAANEMGDSLPAVSLGTGRTAVAVVAGWQHSCALLDNGALKCWGANQNGQLGLGDNAARGLSAGEMGDALPAVSLGSGRTAVAVTASGFHTCALLDNGSVKCWGSSQYGQLGLGDTVSRGDGPGEMGDALAAVSLGSGRTAVAVSSGNYHSCALLDNGTVKCWGWNGYGQLGLGDTSSRGDNANEMGDAQIGRAHV